MREAMFIKKNAEKWQKYQHEATNDPDEMAERFVTLVDDLSYAKTFYPRSKVTRWINGIAASIYQNIYRNKKEKYSRFFTFWRYELPLLFKRYHKILLFTFLVFALFTIIGIWGAANKKDFIDGILGPGTIDELEDKISRGDPFDMYKDENKFTMFVRIAMNNTFISFFMVIGGFFLGFPTLFSWPIFRIAGLWSTGLMLGSFQYVYFSHNLGWQSILVVWIHGTLEIFSIIISASAGFIITASMLFPGTYTRFQSLKRGVKDALKVMIVLIPFFILAAFFESYITRLMSQSFDKEKNFGLPIWASILILASSLSLIVWYFVILPIKLNKKGYYLRQDGIVQRLLNKDV